MKKYSIDIAGCVRAKEYLISALEGGFLSHAYIVEGAPGSGRHTLIKELIKAMACESDNAPCGVCGCCMKIGAGVCVDVRTIRADDNKTELTVDLIRGIYDMVGLMPNDLPFKAYIIEDGERMNRSAQNAFLKLFEEPPENVYFFIITSDSACLLPTIRSRALTLRTEKLDGDEMNAVLDRAGIPKGLRRAAAVTAANGCAGEAIRIYNEDSDAVRMRKIADEIADAVFLPGQDKLSFITLHQKNIKKTEELRRVYELLQRAVMMCRLDAGGQLLYIADRESAEERSLHVSDKAAMNMNAVISELLSLSDVPLNAALAVTEFSGRLWDAHLA